MTNVEGFQNSSGRKESEVVVNLSRQQMKEGLLQLPKGVAGMVWHVGSDPLVDSFNSVVMEAKRSGFVSWIQGKTALENMNIQPYYFPQLGLTYDVNKRKIVLEDNFEIKDFQEALQKVFESKDGLDFHPDSAPGWHQLIKNAHELDNIQLLKTQIASPSCSRDKLSEELIVYQPDIYKLLVKGHINQARKLSSRIVMSIDDPKYFSPATLRENLSIMFGDKFDQEGHLISTDMDVMRAVHCCGDIEALGAIETGAVDVVHYDAWKYGEAPLMGRPDVLRNFTRNNGMFAWGGIPQSLPYLQELGEKLEIPTEIKSRDDYLKLAEKLEKNIEKAHVHVLKNYSQWLKAIAKESGLSKSEIARRTFISATCGYVGNDISALRNFAYDLSRMVAESNKEIAQ